MKRHTSRPVVCILREMSYPRVRLSEAVRYLTRLILGDYIRRVSRPPGGSRGW